LYPTEGRPIRPQGTQNVVFVVEAEPRGNGKSCLQVAQSSDPTAYIDQVTHAIVGKQQNCNSQPCQKNCTMGAWSADASAPPDCQGGTQLYTRSMLIDQTLKDGEYTVTARCDVGAAYGRMDPTTRNRLCAPVPYNGTGTCPQPDSGSSWTFKDAASVYTNSMFSYVTDSTPSLGNTGSKVWDPYISGPGCYHACFIGCGWGGVGPNIDGSHNNHCMTHCDNGSTTASDNSGTHFSTTTGAIVQPSSIGCPTGYRWDGQMPHAATDPKTGVTSNTFWCATDTSYMACNNPRYPYLDNSLNPPMCVSQLRT
jgi:hypothetical protein